MIKIKPDSYDSSEIADAGTQSGELENGRRQDPMGSEGNRTPDSKQQISGHHDPIQRRNFKLVFGLSLSTAFCGLILLSVWMLKLRSGVNVSDADGLTNLHPLMMYTFMVTVNMYSVMVYRTHFHRSKSFLKWMHTILMGVSLTASLLGVIAIFRAHAIRSIPDWYTLHSWIGTMTMALYVSQFLAGFLAFLKPGFSPQIRAALMPWHRFNGTALVVLAGLAAITGMTELVLFKDIADYKSFKPITYLVNFSGISIIVSVAGVVYLLTEPNYLRPKLSEEEPLKR